MRIKRRLTDISHGWSIYLAKALIEWLNAKKPNEHREQIAGIIQTLNSLRPPRKRFEVVKGNERKAIRVGVPEGAELERLPDDKFRFSYSLSTTKGMDWFSTLHNLNEGYRDCRPYPQFLYPVGEGWKVDWKSDSDLVAHRFVIVLLARDGVLRRVRCCLVSDCRKWFFAKRRRDQKCCSESCRKKKYGSSPKGKAHKRKYMRGYMAAKRKEGK